MFDMNGLVDGLRYKEKSSLKDFSFYQQSGNLEKSMMLKKVYPVEYGMELVGQSLGLQCEKFEKIWQR